jgi:hypothetical protein
MIPESEKEIRALFDELKEKYGRDCFGQGYLFRIISNDEIADTSLMTSDEKINGINNKQRTYVPYDKGDKDGNRYYLETPYYIDWSFDNVKWLKDNAGKKERGSSRYQNPQFYFKEGFCYSDIKTFYIRSRLKGVSVHDVKSMSLFPLNEKVPAFYLVSVLNSKLAAILVYNFLNNTPSFQINDCRSFPIVVPSNNQLESVKELFDKCVEIKKSYFNGKESKMASDEKIEMIQKKLDVLICNIYGFNDSEIEVINQYRAEEKNI